MADINRLARVVNGLPRNQALNENTLVLDNAKLLLGSGNAANHATFSGSLTAARSILVPDADVNLGHIASLVALSGVAGGETNLGTFTGATIADGSTIKSALQSLESAIEGFDTSGKANTNLNNLVTGLTLIPANVQLNSLSTSQTIGSEFEFRTSDQAASASGSIRLRSGNTTGAFVSGGARLASGFNTNATGATASSTVTGVASIRSGNISGGTLGSTGAASVSSGDVTSAAVSGRSGDAGIFTGNNVGTGHDLFGAQVGPTGTGTAFVRSGEANSATAGRSGPTTLGTGRSLAATSGDMIIFTGNVTSAFEYPGGINNSANTSATGAINVSSGRIDNASSTAQTGNLNLRTGNHAGAGESGSITIETGTSATGDRGSILLRGRDIDLNAATGGIFLDAAAGSINLQATGVGESIILNPESHVSVSNKQIKDLADPTDAQDAATKFYVDSIAQGLSPKGSVRVATTAPVDLATALENGDTLDGVILTTGDRVLVKNQASASANGVYVVQATGAAVRAADFDGSPSIEVKGGDWVYVEEGTANEGTSWAVLGSGAKVVGTDPINWTKINKVTPFQSGAAITISGDQVNVDIEKQAEKLTTVDDDLLLVADSEDSGALKKVKKSTLLAGLVQSVESVQIFAQTGDTLPVSGNLRAMRWGKGAETLGWMYLADNDASVNDNFYVAGIVLTNSQTVGGNIQPVSHGKLTVSHAFAVGLPIYLGANGVITQTPPSAADTAVVYLGIPSSSSTIDVSIRVVGVN